MLSYKRYLWFILWTLVHCDVNMNSVSEETCDAGKGSKCSTCVLTPQSGEGPFYIPDPLLRSDIKEGRAGVPLKLTLIVKDVAKCKPLSQVQVDIWQSDAVGVYSGFLDFYPLGKPGSKFLTGEREQPTDKSRFLRGSQLTDASGRAEFQTIFPGWYLGRAIHIHVEIFMKGHPKYTGQLYFPEHVIEQVALEIPYKNNKERRMRNNEDWQWGKLGGSKSTLTITGDIAKGFESTMELGIDVDYEL